jgi:hypothetical protein
VALQPLERFATERLEAGNGRRDNLTAGVPVSFQEVRILKPAVERPLRDAHGRCLLADGAVLHQGGDCPCLRARELPGIVGLVQFWTLQRANLSGIVYR